MAAIFILPSNYGKCEKNFKEKQDVLLKIILRKLEQQVKYRRPFQQRGRGPIGERGEGGFRFHAGHAGEEPNFPQVRCLHRVCTAKLVGIPSHCLHGPRTGVQKELNSRCTLFEKTVATCSLLLTSGQEPCEGALGVCITVTFPVS